MCENKDKIWIVRDFLRCSGCRKCEIVCSSRHENKIWPEASRIRVFMLVPGVEVPHFCVQCEDYPCVQACLAGALSVSDKTGAVLVDTSACTGCGRCIEACPGKVPHIHPRDNYVLICDLCDGDPQCVKVCQEGSWNALRIASGLPVQGGNSYRLYARTPDEITKALITKLYGKKCEDFL